MSNVLCINSCISSIQFKSEFQQVFRLLIAVNAIFFTLLLSKQPRFQSNVPENREQSAFRVKPNTVVVRWNIVGRVARNNKARDTEL